MRDGPAAPALSRVGARAMAANKGLGFIWSELSTPGRQNLPSAGPVTPGFGQSFRSAWSEGAGQPPQRRPAGPGVVPGGLQAFLGEPDKKPPVAGWRLDRSQQQFGFRPQVPGANPAPPRPADFKGMPAPPGVPRPKAPLPPKPEPAPGVIVQRSTDRLNQLMENSRRHFDRVLAEGGPTARQLLEARLAKARLARSLSDDPKAAKGKPAEPPSQPAVARQTPVRVKVEVPQPPRPPEPPASRAASRAAPAPRPPAPAVPAPARLDASRPTSELPKPAPKKPAESKTADAPGEPPAQRPAETARTESAPAPEKPGAPEPPQARPTVKPAEPEAAPKPPAPGQPEKAEPAAAPTPRPKEAATAEPPPARTPEVPRAEPVRPEAPRTEPRPSPTPTPTPTPAAGREGPPTPTPAPTPAKPAAAEPQQPSGRPRTPVERSAALRELPGQSPPQPRSEPRVTAPREAQVRLQPPAREAPPPPPAVRAPVDPRRDRPVEAPRESEAAKEERAVRTRGSEVAPIPGQPRRHIQEEPFHKNVRESGRSHQEHEREHGHEESEDEQQQGKGKGKGKEERLERKRPPSEQQKGRGSSASDPARQQQAARKLTQTRENFQLALRKLEAMSQAKAGETVATRNAAQAIGALLKKAYREQELQDLDEESAVNALGLLLKIGGEETYKHSARVLDLAMGLAEEVGADAQTRKQTRQGALLKDLGDVGQVYRGQSDDALDELGGLLSRQDLRKASLLQDIGNLRIPREILARRGQLSVDERQIMRMHPVYGAEMVRPIVSLRHLCPIIRGHHERWDGQGYPDGLKAEQIPLPARIIAVADLFDALRTDRPGKAGLDPASAWEILSEGSGTHFDPWLVAAFGRYLKRRYPGM